MKILYEDNHIIVVVKPVNMPVCEDASKDLDLLSSIKDYLKEKYNKPGNVYLGLIHRLDRPVGGVMVFAKTSKAASRLSEEVRLHKMNKQYYAVIMGTLLCKESVLKDKLLKDPATNITKVSDLGKEAILEYKKVSSVNDLTLVRVNLITGRSHQIRVQFASRNMPLYGDSKYGNMSKDHIALFAYSLTFTHPITKERLTFEEHLPNIYPFSLFKDTV